MEDWNVCRLCLQTSPESLKEVSAVSYDMIPFWNLYYELIGTVLIEYPTFPSRICPTCEYDMHQAYTFRQRCLETEDKLKETLEDTKSIVKPESPSIVKEEDKKPDILGESSTTTHEPKLEEISVLTEVTEKKCAKKYDSETAEYLKNKIIKCKHCLETMLGLEQFKKHRCSKKDPVNETVVKPEKGTKRKRIREKKVYTCSTCSKEFTCQSAFKYHRDRHNNFKRYVCEHCGKGFFDWSARRTHIYRAHLKTSLFQCSHCDKQFYKKILLTEHIETYHLKIRQCQCEVCGMKFQYPRVLNSHKRIHEKGGPCEICGKVLKNARTLYHHMRTHSSEKNYECKVCNSSFTCNWSLKNHIRKKHPDQTHLIPPSGTIVSKKFLENLANYDSNV